MLRNAARRADDHFPLKIKGRISKSLRSLAMDRKHRDLVDTYCEENKTRVLALRRELLQLLLDNNGKVRVSSLPAETVRFRPAACTSSWLRWTSYRSVPSMTPWPRWTSSMLCPTTPWC